VVNALKSSTKSERNVSAIKSLLGCSNVVRDSDSSHSGRHKHGGQLVVSGLDDVLASRGTLPSVRIHSCGPPRLLGLFGTPAGAIPGLIVATTTFGTLQLSNGGTLESGD
jgi:hypothetical protein